MIAKKKASTYFQRMETSLGTLLLVGEQEPDRFALTGIYFDGAAHARNAFDAETRENPSVFCHAREQLASYLAGQRTTFDLELSPAGTPFQRRVWAALAAIPYGATRSYAELAQSLGKPTATRAVGAANGRNPLSIVVPCHRVIGASGALTGYAGGIANKQRLLELEARACALRS